MSRGFLRTLFRAVRDGRIGFKAEEVMTGTHHFMKGIQPGKERPLEFSGNWGSDNLAAFIKNILTAKPAVAWLIGEVSVGGLCKRAPMHGKLELNYLGQGKIRYTFNFTCNKKYYLYVGEKRNIKLWNLPKSHTTCYGKLYEVHAGGLGNPELELVSESITYFRLCTAPAFLLSFRLA